MCIRDSARTEAEFGGLGACLFSISRDLHISVESRILEGRTLGFRLIFLWGANEFSYKKVIDDLVFKDDGSLLT